MKRIYNFNAGPSALPLEVLQQIQEEFLDFDGSGMSVVELSHRSKWFDKILDGAIERVRRIFKLTSGHHVLFLQGGASHQFCMIPMNLLPLGQSADYVDTGTWSTMAIREAHIQGKGVNIAASSEDKNFSYIPKNISLHKNAAYVHITSNNTIEGTQWQTFPDTGLIPIVCDMSSDIMSRPIDITPFGFIYAGAQKNLGPAGVTLAIIRDDMLKGIPKGLPTMLNYATFVSANSMYNTPPCFAIYAVGLVLKWIEEQIGGLQEMEQLNTLKAELLYKTIDETGFFRGTAQEDSRSKMNVTFRLASESLEDEFVSQATKQGLVGLKGHRSVGGCRASIYNAVTMEAIQALTQFMKEFERKHG